MSDTTASFTGTIPENYDRYMGPMFFEPYAADLAARLAVPPAAEILEIACGTGIVTKELCRTLPADARITATDLNEAMIDYAARSVGAGKAISWQKADACSLPFEDGQFDAAVCQFGLMFVPDKQQAIDEVFRVLKPGGQFVFNVWDRIQANEISDVVSRVVAEHFPNDPPDFYRVPFSLFDTAALESMLRKSGFGSLRHENVVLSTVSKTAENAARGLIEGSPMVLQIKERDAGAIEPLIERATAALAERFGSAPCKAKMSAFVFAAVR
jgi:ubiquinone/menaquinone biosynthesis C-methylase UbiE